MTPYPADWPRCPVCDDFALDGHITCGRSECDESGQRNSRSHLEVTSWPKPRVSNPHFLSDLLDDWKNPK
jgi:hypothetical protein